MSGSCEADTDMTYAASDPEPVGSPEPPTDAVPAEPAGPVVTTIRRGPGVIPPFVAPPREGVKRRRWIGLGIAAAIVALCCGGGGAGLFGLLVTIKNQRYSDATTVVTNYLNDRAHSHYATAYQLLCVGLKEEYTLPEFTAQVVDDPILDFVVSEPFQNGSDLLVPVNINYVSGDHASAEYDVVVDADGSSRVCGSAHI